MIVNSPIGKITLCGLQGALTHLAFSTQKQQANSDSHAIMMTAEQQLDHYFNDPKYQFNLPLQPQGTVFQTKVWQALLRIPCGATLTYGELAKQLHTSARAIGNACRANPIAIIIPCHRIVAQSHMGGYGGKLGGNMLAKKQWLLRHEHRTASHVRNDHEITSGSSHNFMSD